MTTLIVITGPTAVGKTALTIELARHYGIPVINADSRQIYKELRIGTASPTEEQLSMVQHYFVHWFAHLLNMKYSFADLEMNIPQFLDLLYHYLKHLLL